MNRGHCTGNDVCLYLQPKTGHTYGILDPFLTIYYITTRDNMNDLAIRGNSNSTSDLDCAANVVLYNISMAWRDGYKSFTIFRINVTTRNPDVCGSYVLS